MTLLAISPKNARQVRLARAQSNSLPLDYCRLSSDADVSDVEYTTAQDFVMSIRSRPKHAGTCAIVKLKIEIFANSRSIALDGNWDLQY